MVLLIGFLISTNIDSYMCCQKLMIMLRLGISCFIMGLMSTSDMVDRLNAICVELVFIISSFCTSGYEESCLLRRRFTFTIWRDYLLFQKL